EAGIALEVRSLAGAGHRTKAEIVVRELTLDAGNARRAVSPKRRDRLVATGLEQSSHSAGELWFRLLDRLPPRHGGAAYPQVQSMRANQREGVLHVPLRGVEVVRRGMDFHSFERPDMRNAPA